MTNLVENIEGKMTKEEFVCTCAGFEEYDIEPGVPMRKKKYKEIVTLVDYCLVKVDFYRRINSKWNLIDYKFFSFPEEWMPDMLQWFPDPTKTLEEQLEEV